MPFSSTPDDWIEVPAGRYRIGLTRDDAHTLARHSAAFAHEQGPEFSLNAAKMLLRSMQLEEEVGNVAWIEKRLLERFPAREVARCIRDRKEASDHPTVSGVHGRDGGSRRAAQLGPRRRKS